MGGVVNIADLLQANFINLNLSAADKDAAVKAVAHMGKDHPDIEDFPSFCRSVYEREAAGSTSIGRGIAIPHARTDVCKHMVLIVARLHDGILFDEKDLEPVRFIFLVGTPKRMVTDYLRIVGSLARCMKDDAFRKKLQEASTPEEFIEIFKAKEA
jgi:mannitol/fructose-specific phosphotransferase system IIA component (Ntr-type)